MEFTYVQDIAEIRKSQSFIICHECEYPAAFPVMCPRCLILRCRFCLESCQTPECCFLVGPFVQIGVNGCGNVQKELERLEVKCTINLVNGCEWQGSREAYLDHCLVCNENFAECSFGCGKKIKLDDEIHFRKCPQFYSWLKESNVEPGSGEANIKIHLQNLYRIYNRCEKKKKTKPVSQIAPLPIPPIPKLLPANDISVIDINAFTAAHLKSTGPMRVITQDGVQTITPGYHLVVAVGGGGGAGISNCGFEGGGGSGYIDACVLRVNQNTNMNIKIGKGGSGGKGGTFSGRPKIYPSNANCSSSTYYSSISVFQELVQCAPDSTHYPGNSGNYSYTHIISKTGIIKIAHPMEMPNDGENTIVTISKFNFTAQGGQCAQISGIGGMGFSGGGGSNRSGTQTEISEYPNNNVNNNNVIKEYGHGGSDGSDGSKYAGTGSRSNIIEVLEKFSKNFQPGVGGIHKDCGGGGGGLLISNNPPLNPRSAGRNGFSVPITERKETGYGAGGGGFIPKNNAPLIQNSQPNRADGIIYQTILTPAANGYTYLSGNSGSDGCVVLMELFLN